MRLGFRFIAPLGRKLIEEKSIRRGCGRVDRRANAHGVPTPNVVWCIRTPFGRASCGTSMLVLVGTIFCELKDQVNMSSSQVKQQDDPSTSHVIIAVQSRCAFPSAVP